MTLPAERRFAIEHARTFLRDLLIPTKTPRVPKSVRLSAYWVLRHFPTEHDMEQAVKKAPKIWGKKGDR
jgi:hypothetical protein